VDVSLVPRNAEEETAVIGDLVKRLRELDENLKNKNNAYSSCNELCFIKARDPMDVSV
jgi:hypothetical protein